MQGATTRNTGSILRRSNAADGAVPPERWMSYFVTDANGVRGDFDGKCVVYEIWVDGAAFGDAGYGDAVIENVHASPSKRQDNTVEVVPGDCPVCDPAVEVCDPWTFPDADGGLDGGFGIGWDGSIE